VTTGETNVRRAVPDDLEILLELVAEFCDADGHVFDESVVRAGLEPLLADNSLGTVWMIDGTDGDAVVTWGWSIEIGGPEAVLDELYVRLVVSGSPRPGGQVDVKVIGEPGARAFWAVALKTLAPPLSIPGLQGQLVLDPVGAVIFDLGALPASGETPFSVAIPNPFPVTTVTMQTLMRDQLSLAKTVTIR